ncbi:hypothetical protein [Mariniblastus fucicola]|uniref:Uncharacterized protein n=1 Tax=Mariniblastus fucicola TaxID=980251 RepID=A0A5B9PGJ2_9BACT|nr:hypothetical protein [Mariniblastus fucicola]QEG23716.1 hypothetical protein MFFC18_36170 [Mariniblastus fucicola]
MNQSSKIIIAFCLVFTFFMSTQADTSRLQAQIVSQSCGCGNAKCSGCLKGKLFPVKKLASTIKPKKPCNCEACLAATGGRETVTSDILISTEMLPEVVPAPVAAPVSRVACGCGRKPCSCKTPMPRRKLIRSKTVCPQCDCDFCDLKVEKSTEKKECYEVKQEEICIPPVRLPWKKSCPPTKAKVRVVNVLGSKTYECPTCKYEWKVYEPEVPGGSSDSGSSEQEPVVAPINEVDPVTPAAPKMNIPTTPDVEKLDLKNVPQPPVEDA